MQMSSQGSMKYCQSSGDATSPTEKTYKILLYLMQFFLFFLYLWIILQKKIIFAFLDSDSDLEL